MRRVSGVTPADLSSLLRPLDRDHLPTQPQESPPRTGTHRTREQTHPPCLRALGAGLENPDGRDEEFHHQAEKELNAGVTGEEEAENVSSNDLRHHRVAHGRRPVAFFAAIQATISTQIFVSYSSGPDWSRDSSLLNAEMFIPLNSSRPFYIYDPLRTETL